MQMGLIGSAIGVAGSIFGGIAASKAMNKVKNNIKEQQKKNRDWYDRRYNEDATQRADAQRILTLTEESIKNRNRQAAGAAAVMGGTDESVAGVRSANAQAIADAAAQIAVNASDRKDNIEQMYQQNDAALQEQLNELEAGRANQISKATAAVGEFAGNLPF